MRKGRRLAVDGRLEWREWETGDEQKRQAVSIVADTVQFLDGPGEPGEGGAGSGAQPGDGEPRAPMGASSSASEQAARTTTSSSSRLGDRPQVPRLGPATRLTAGVSVRRPPL